MLKPNLFAFEPFLHVQNFKAIKRRVCVYGVFVSVQNKDGKEERKN